MKNNILNLQKFRVKDDNSSKHFSIICNKVVGSISWHNFTNIFGL